MKYLEAESDHMVQAGDFPTSLIMADCNYLKRTNDTMGHEYGDLLLQRTADAIRESIPKSCVAMRVGGAGANKTYIIDIRKYHFCIGNPRKSLL